VFRGWDEKSTGRRWTIPKKMGRTRKTEVCKRKKGYFINDDSYGVAAQIVEFDDRSR